MRFIFLSLLMMFFISGCGDDTSEKKGDCGDRCQSWERCIESSCELKEGYCELNSNCNKNSEGKSVCDLNQDNTTFHQCIKPAVFDCNSCKEGEQCNDTKDGCIPFTFDCSGCIAPMKCNDDATACIFDCTTCTGELICNVAQDGCIIPDFDCDTCTGHMTCNDNQDGCIAKDGMCDTSTDCAVNERKKDCDRDTHTCTDIIPCEPNFCLNDADLVAAHKTRCMPEIEGEYKCVCNLFEDYYEDNGICCKFKSHNEDGICVCNEGYVLSNDGVCVVECSAPETIIGSLDGYCEPGYTCQQGNCVEDLCVDVDCSGKPNSSCKAGSCACHTPDYHKESYGSGTDEFYCCGDHQVANSGGCICADGYEDDGSGTCIPEPENPCKNNPCENTTISHQNTCIQDESDQGYYCDCNSGYVFNNGSCDLITYTDCPSNFQCLGNYCVTNDWQCEPDTSCAPANSDECLTDADCCYDGACSTCEKETGRCKYCIEFDCPNDQICKYAMCLSECDDQSDCPDNRTCRAGVCAITYCTTTDDCEVGEHCVNDDGESGKGLCKRMGCTESACSPASPSGSCDTGVCLYGSCVDSCDSNPCDDEDDPFRHNCEMTNGVPFCVCDAGYEIRDGKCLPEIQTSCPSGFTCSNGYCADLNNSSIVCTTDDHCGASGMSCTPTSPAGSCSGCDATHPCPGTMACVYGYCLQECSDPDECHEGMSCNNGYCGKKSCTTLSDCPTGYTCDISMSCKRQPCE